MDYRIILIHLPYNSVHTAFCVPSQHIHIIYVAIIHIHGLCSVESYKSTIILYVLNKKTETDTQVQFTCIQGILEFMNINTHHLATLTLTLNTYACIAVL